MDAQYGLTLESFTKQPLVSLAICATGIAVHHGCELLPDSIQHILARDWALTATKAAALANI